MSLPSIQAARGWSGLTVVDSDEQPLGRIIHIYLDRDTELPEWALVAMSGRRRRTFVPLAGATRRGNRVAVAVSTAAVGDAPAIRPGRELSDDDAARLYRHYVGGASDDRKRGARRAPGRGLAARLKEATAPPAKSAAARLGTARSRLQEATRSGRRRRLLSLAGLGSALAAAAVFAGRTRRRRAPDVGEALGEMLAATRATLRSRRQRQPRAGQRPPAVPTTALRLRLRGARQAAGAPGAAAGRRMPSPPRPRTRRSPMAGNFKLAAGLAAGYVLGARAGRERYERLAELARQVAQRPEVQQLADRARSGLDAGIERATGAASDRLEQARTSMAPADTEAAAPPEPRTEPAGEGGRSNLSGRSSPAARGQRSSSDR